MCELQKEVHDKHAAEIHSLIDGSNHVACAIRWSRSHRIELDEGKRGGDAASVDPSVDRMELVCCAKEPLEEHVDSFFRE